VLTSTSISKQRQKSRQLLAYALCYFGAADIEKQQHHPDKTATMSLQDSFQNHHHLMTVVHVSTFARFGGKWHSK